MVSVELLFLLSAVVALVYFWCKYAYSYWQRKGVAYVEPLPLIGNAKCLFTMSRNFGLYLTDVYNDPKFANEPVVGIYIFNKPALVIREPELVKSILIKDFNKFSNRYGQADPHNDPLGSNNLFFVRNPEWKEIRTKISPVFTSGKIKQMYPLMLEIANDLETHLAEKCASNKSFEAEVKEICALFTTDMIATIAYGLRANSLKNPNAEFRSQGRRIFTFTISRGFDFFVSFFLPKLTSVLRTKVFDKEISHFLRSTINYAIKERQAAGTVRNDLIDILIALKKQAELEPNPDHFSKNNDFLVAQAALFFTAGFETSSSTMSFALYELAKKPELQQRLRNEINEALLEGNGTMSYEKINSLEYLGMVVDETLRMYPVLPFLDREYEKQAGDKNYTLEPYSKYELQNGLPVYIPIYGLQRDPKFWSDPDTFDPERFSPENRKLHNPMTYLPFGTGPHNCIGMRVGLLQSKIGMVHLLKNHFVSVTDKTKREMVFEPKAFILQCIEGIYLKVVNDGMYDKAAA